MKILKQRELCSCRGRFWIFAKFTIVLNQRNKFSVRFFLSFYAGFCATALFLSTSWYNLPLRSFHSASKKLTRENLLCSNGRYVSKSFMDGSSVSLSSLSCFQTHSYYYTRGRLGLRFHAVQVKDGFFINNVCLLTVTTTKYTLKKSIWRRYEK